MKKSLILIVLLTGALFAKNAGEVTPQTQVTTPDAQMGAAAAGHGWSNGENLGTGSENANGEIADPGQPWATQEGHEKGSEDSQKNTAE